MPKRPEQSNKIDLHPSDWDEKWQPPIGNDPRPGEKPHIWQEFERDRSMRRADPNEPIFGSGWVLIVGVALLIAGLTWLEVGGGPEWLIAIRNLF